MTTQVGDELFLGSRKHALQGYPTLPLWDPRLSKRPESEWRSKDWDCCSSDCHRGYVGTWAIRDGRLFLRAVRGAYRLDANEAIFAEWFTGQLIVPRGEVIRRGSIGGIKIFEEEEQIAVQQGVVIQRTVVDNRKKFLKET
jgi:hypothetical protein